MKSTIYQSRIVVFIFAIFSSLLSAQYTGGISDGNSAQQVTNLSCGLAPGQFAYTGGVGDGNSANTKIYTTCGYAPGHYAYMGGINDGAAVDTKMYNLCPYPPGFYAYFGGSGDGNSVNKLQNCAIVLPVADFTGTPLEICVNQNVTFADASTNAVAWEWTVTGGTFVSPSTMYSQNPVVKYATAGTYAVTLKARNQDGDNTITKTAYIKVNASASITGTTPGERCGPGSVVLSATPSSGTVRWYSTSTGGVPLGTGLTFNTPSVSSNTNFYAEAFNGCVSSTRTAVMAKVIPLPAVLNTFPAERCGPGQVTLNVSTNYGIAQWYDSAVGGNLVATGPSYSPTITQTTTYYVETYNGNCISDRVSITATVKPIPTITGTNPGSRCGAGAVNLSATANVGTINWYNQATNGTLLATGASYSPVINTTTTYYVSSTNNNCESPRVAVTAEVLSVPTITSTTPASRCGTGSVTLGATASAGTMSWYAAATGGTALGTGATFTTPSLSTSTTYYVETGNGICNSGRTAVTATVNNTSAPTGNTTQNLCGNKTLADLVVSGSNIIWYDAATNGNVLPSTTTVVYGTTYYASQTVNGCESTDRLAVTVINSGCLSTNENITFRVNLYPNPVSEILNIKYDNPISQIEIYSMNGQKVSTIVQKSNHYKVDFSKYPSAAYLVKVFADGKEVRTYKVIRK